MILPLIILYVVTLVYLAITERFRNFASLIGLQGWLLFAVALVRLHAINPAELAFICLETLLFKGILVPGLLFAVIRRTKINRVSRSGSTQSGSLLLSLVALAVSASVTYYIADTTIDLVFFGVAFYSLLSGLILIVMRRRIFSHLYFSEYSPRLHLQKTMPLFLSDGFFPYLQQGPDPYWAGSAQPLTWQNQFPEAGQIPFL